jgi:hypothetical protein
MTRTYKTTVGTGLKAMAMALSVALTMATVTVSGAAQAAAAPHQSGTIKSATADGLTLTTTAGQAYTVTLPATAKILVVAPGGTAATATAGAASDVAVGDKAIVIGTATDTGTTLTATKVYLMKSAAIAESHAADDAAWAQGTGGIVKSVDAATGTVVVSSGMKTITVSTVPQTIYRHYASGSVSFADATVCKLTDVKPGDQLRVRGKKSPDGTSVVADEMVAGTFHNYSGLLTAVDAAAGTVTLKDLATKKVVTVTLTPGSDVRRIAPMMAQRLAAQMKGTAAAAGAGATPVADGGGRPGGGAGYGGAGGGGAGGDAGSARRAGAGRAGADLSQMLARLPKETASGLKTGEAVMIVASSPASDPSKSTAVTLVVGVDPILTAAPEGEMTLSPWNIGGGAGGGGEGGGL